MLLAEFGTGQVFWSMLWFFLFFIWIWMLVVVFGDIFRSADLGGWGKALWCIFIIVLPFLGVFVYLITRGHKMQEHQIRRLPVIDDGHPVDEHSVDARGVGVQAPSAAWQVVAHPLGLVADRVGIEDDEIGGPSRRDPPTSPHAVEASRDVEHASHHLDDALALGKPQHLICSIVGQGAHAASVRTTAMAIGRRAFMDI